MKNKKAISTTMWGLFFEDINRSADGGVYAELIKNRSFDFPDSFTGWGRIPSSYEKNHVFQVINRSATNPNNPKFLQATIDKPGRIFLWNEGFGGIAFARNKTLDLTVVYRSKKSGISLQVELINEKGKVAGITRITPEGNDWKTVNATITTFDSSVTGQLRISFEGTGQLDIDRISLFPSDTWQHRPAGMRNDLVQKLAAIKPGFMRFPGGCIVEGQRIDNRYIWKETIGHIDQRKLKFNNWNNAVPSRALPDYYQSFGLGFFEYFQLCADMKAEPMPIINCGISCQFGAGEVVSLEDIDPYVKDALDLIEFANGDSSSIWGKKRVEMGRREPFNMKMLGVGNENWGPQYIERLKFFTDAIKEKYPYIKIIAATGYSPNAQFRYIDSVLRKLNTDIIDEHYYQKPAWFLMNASKYDHYDRKGPQIFIGEYACHSEGIGSANNKNTQLCALAEAAFMTGLERNADIVTMAAYAPLFAHVKDWQWTPNLIWFDNRKSYATPSYYVQQLFANNKGTHAISLLEEGKPICGQDSLWASTVIDIHAREFIIKIVNPSGTSKHKTISIPQLLLRKSFGTVTTLASPDVKATNSLDGPETVSPKTTNITISNKKLLIELVPYSLNIIKIKMS